MARDYITIGNTRDKLIDTCLKMTKEFSNLGAIENRRGMMQERMRILTILATMIPSTGENDSNEEKCIFIMNLMTRIQSEGI